MYRNFLAFVEGRNGFIKCLVFAQTSEEVMRSDWCLWSFEQGFIHIIGATSRFLSTCLTQKYCFCKSRKNWLWSRRHKTIYKATSAKNHLQKDKHEKNSKKQAPNKKIIKAIRPHKTNLTTAKKISEATSPSKIFKTKIEKIQSHKC